MSGGSQDNVGEGPREWPVWLIWVLLAGASVLGFLFAEGMAPPRIAAISAIVLAVIKVHLVIDHYMEVGWRHRPLRLLLAIWLAVVTAVILGTYLLT